MANPSAKISSQEHPLEFIFHPRALAVVGASSDPDGQGNMFVAGPKRLGFKGPIYPINPKATEIQGLKAYPSILDVPGVLDYVISSIPAAAVPNLLRQCGQKGVRFVHLFTAGFRETGDSARTDLEQHILQVAREEGIRLLGPNCMGIYYPEGGLSFSPAFSRTAGSVAMLSQSGTNASEMVGFGASRGLHFSKVLSFGNALDINESDILEYFVADSNTDFIGAYIEGPADGRRFFATLREATKHKPVVILKGGRTQAGTRAISSHTGSLAGPSVLWDTLCRQTGAIRVFGMDELVDVMMTLASGVQLRGNRVAILGGGGGASVLAADDCAAQDLQVPSFSKELQEELRPLVHEAGTSVRNPVDAGALIRSTEMQKATTAIGRTGEVDVCFLHMSSGLGMGGPGGHAGAAGGGEESVEEAVNGLVAATRSAGVPFFIVLRNEGGRRGGMERMQQFSFACARAGLPVFPSMTRAASALQKVLQYQSWRADAEG